MNTGGWLFLGVFLTFASAWIGLVLLPNEQLKGLEPQKDEITGAQNPSPYSGEALEGRRVYIANGCVYCHSQQVRGGHWNADLNRGWGMRRSHPRDYIYDFPHLLGTARTGAYFSVAPFFGAATAVVLLAERPGALFWVAAVLMALGVWLHVTERHDHPHRHERLIHTHMHRHDEHHQHEHPDGWGGVEPHTHEHEHAPMVHTHPHYPDLHHRHRHG